MLEWLGEKEAARLLLEVIETVCEKGIVTKDLGGNSTTVEVTKATCEEIEKQLGGKKREKLSVPQPVEGDFVGTAIRA